MSKLPAKLSRYPHSTQPLEYVNKFGRNLDIDGTEETIWRAGGVFTGGGTNYEDTAQTIEVVSSSINDDVGGSSAEAIIISGLQSWADSEYSEETILLDGTTAVEASNTWVIINRAYVVGNTAASRGARLNDGVITVRKKTGGTTWAQIAAGVGQTEQAVLGIPAGKRAFVTEYYANALRATASAYNIFVKVSDESGDNHNAFITKHVLSNDSVMDHRFEPPAQFPGPCVIQLTMTTTQTNVDAVAGFDVILLKG